MPISALHSPYGIGTLGKAAYEFVDFLFNANQSYWQMLPLGPTSYGDSPYQSFSSFAGNPYYIDLDMLVEDGLLLKEEIKSKLFGSDSGKIDYEAIYNNRFSVLHKAFERGMAANTQEFFTFVSDNSEWLTDYSLFMALKYHFDMKPWTEWEDENIRLRKDDAIRYYTALLNDDIKFFQYIQFLFYKQWNALRAYAKEKGIGIIGDIPIYVALDSADVWANPGCFQLDSENRPIEVAGVPPDCFSADGQLWGNPLYDWDAMKQDGYGWWIRRIAGATVLYDVIRIDHFRGFESYWAVPADATTAKDGRWVKGPGMDFVGVMTSWFSNIQFIAEDLGYLTQEVRDLLRDSGLPGMKVLEFAFDSREPSNYLPHTYTENCICYVGTHDNAPILAWKDEADKEDVKFAIEYLGLNDEEGFSTGIIRGGMSSVSKLFITQMQDYLGLGVESRMNVPGIVGGNWQWRLKKRMLTKKLASQMARCAFIYGRSNPKWLEEKNKGDD